MLEGVSLRTLVKVEILGTGMSVPEKLSQLFLQSTYLVTLNSMTRETSGTAAVGKLQSLRDQFVKARECVTTECLLVSGGWGGRGVARLDASP